MSDASSQWYRLPRRRRSSSWTASLATWVVAALVASTAIVINELHKRLGAPQPHRDADVGAAA